MQPWEDMTNWLETVKSVWEHAAAVQDHLLGTEEREAWSRELGAWTLELGQVQRGTPWTGSLSVFPLPEELEADPSACHRRSSHSGEHFIMSISAVWLSASLWCGEVPGGPAASLRALLNLHSWSLKGHVPQPLSSLSPHNPNSGN